jgi:hypothetical protein
MAHRRGWVMADAEQVEVGGTDGTTDAGPARGSNVKYPHNVLEGFAMGALLDLRVRVAVDLVKSPMFEGAYARDSHPHAIDAVAEFALSVAGALFDQAEARGWIEPIPGNEDVDLPDSLRAQALRTAGYQVTQQHEGGKMLGRMQSGELMPEQSIMSQIKGGNAGGRH